MCVEFLVRVITIVTVSRLVPRAPTHAPNSRFLTESVIAEMHQEAWRHHLKWLSDSLKRVTEGEEEEEEADTGGSGSSGSR